MHHWAVEPGYFRVRSGVSSILLILVRVTVNSEPKPGNAECEVGIRSGQDASPSQEGIETSYLNFWSPVKENVVVASIVFFLIQILLLC